MTTGLSLAKAKLVKKARFQWGPLLAEPVGLSKHTTFFKIARGPYFQAISGRNFWAVFWARESAKFKLREVGLKTAFRLREENLIC